MGQKQASKKIQLELLLYIGQKPERWHNDEAKMKESDEHYKQRLETWNTGKEWIERFFDTTDDQL